MQKWEYRRHYYESPDQLDTLGLGGWELVGCDSGILFFKRAIPEGEKGLLERIRDGSFGTSEEISVPLNSSNLA